MGFRELGDRSWPFFAAAMGLHTLAYRATGGLIGQSGSPARSEDAAARPRRREERQEAHRRRSSTSPRTTASDVAIVASKGGHPKNPAWYYNLKANPDTTIQIGREKREVRAREATGEERDALFATAARDYCGLRRRTPTRTERKIPVIVLERR